MDTVIVGGGTFGASLAWWLSRAGERVTLVDQFEPGDRRASSGGETRLFRCSHGHDADYTAMARRAQALWRELEAESGEELLVECGVAWFAHREDGWEAASAGTLAAQGIPYEHLDVSSAARLYPSFRGADLAFVLLEPEAGVLRAQRAVRALVARACARGARLVRGRASPDGEAVVLQDSTRLEGDVVVWAPGAWLARLFGDLIPLAVTGQEVLFLDGGEAWGAPGLPAWVDYDRAMYGTADLDALGVKAALDVEAPPLDPDAPLPDTAVSEPDVRAYLRDRFPALEDVPLVEARSCRYELTPDTHFLAAPHPAHPSVWLVGGGSGHGFKHGPAMAEQLGAALAGGAPLPARFGLGKRSRSGSLRTAGSGRET
ncbi:MAG TPA: FAD-dependent oxidoreductase [Thermoleophilaceae bacterium]|nr:FAD-dependent oxidoreductase [Thermoleophilaceae bacterium]